MLIKLSSSRRRLVYLAALFTLVLMLPVLGKTALAQDDALTQGINQAIAAEAIAADARPGYLGIPGGPQINLMLAFFWAVWVGWIFSTVGALSAVSWPVSATSAYTAWETMPRGSGKPRLP
jgi:uncharacterized protein